MESQIKKEKFIEKKRKIKLPRCHRIFLFFIMVGIESIMNVSSGIFSSATKEIKRQLNLNDTKFGSFGTSNSIGRVISSILFGMINKKVSRKWTTIIFVIFHAIFLFFFKLTMNANILLFIRGLLGLTQTTPSVYVPVWINQFGLNNYKTIQITSLQLFQTLGKLLGQLINLIVGFDMGYYFERFGLAMDNKKIFNNSEVSQTYIENMEKAINEGKIKTNIYKKYWYADSEQYNYTLNNGKGCYKNSNDYEIKIINIIKDSENGFYNINRK